jgi:hypothetical protein
MLFMYIATHPVDKCMADKPQEGLKLFSQVRGVEEGGREDTRDVCSWS